MSHHSEQADTPSDDQRYDHQEQQQSHCEAHDVPHRLNVLFADRQGHADDRGSDAAGSLGYWFVH